jgi:hypothetical protein
VVSSHLVPVVSSHLVPVVSPEGIIGVDNVDSVRSFHDSAAMPRASRTEQSRRDEDERLQTALSRSTATANVEAMERENELKLRLGIAMSQSDSIVPPRQAWSGGGADR